MVAFGRFVTSPRSRLRRSLDSHRAKLDARDGSSDCKQAEDDALAAYGGSWWVQDLRSWALDSQPSAARDPRPAWVARFARW